MALVLPLSQCLILLKNKGVNMNDLKYTLIFLAIAGALFLLATIADAAPVPPGTLYDATNGVISWQAPTLNASDLPLQPGELKDCFWAFTWTAGGSTLVTARDVTAGTGYSINVPTSFGVGSASGYCTNSLDVKGSTAVWPVTFRVPPVPQAPVLTK